MTTATPRIDGRGGKREGAGRKPADYVPPQERLDFEAARARHETAKADLAELEYAIKSGQYVSRDAIRQAGATMLAALVQSMRGLSDVLERRGVEASVCAMVDEAVNEVLADTGRAIKNISGDD